MHTPSLKGTAPMNSSWPRAPTSLCAPFLFAQKPPLEGSALNTQVVIFSSDVYEKNVCTNKPFHAQLHSVIYLVTLSNNKNPNRSPPPNSIRKHGSWNTGTVHEAYDCKHGFASIFRRGNPHACWYTPYLQGRRPITIKVSWAERSRLTPPPPPPPLA